MESEELYRAIERLRADLSELREKDKRAPVPLSTVDAEVVDPPKATPDKGLGMGSLLESLATLSESGVLQQFMRRDADRGESRGGLLAGAETDPRLLAALGGLSPEIGKAVSQIQRLWPLLSLVQGRRSSASTAPRARSRVTSSEPPRRITRDRRARSAQAYEEWPVRSWRSGRR